LGITDHQTSFPPFFSLCLSLGGGALVLGQEQDKKGEGFNPAESFVGSLSQLNLWDYVLSPQQVNSIFTV
jgi:hypothetical protein